MRPAPMRSTPKVSHASIRCAVVRHRLCEESCEGVVLSEPRQPAGADGPSHNQGHATPTRVGLSNALPPLDCPIKGG